MIGEMTSNRLLAPDEACYISKLSFSDIELLIPQNEILSIESIYELEDDTGKGGHIGVINKQGVKLPVYCFSDSMDIVDYLPEDRFQCVAVRHNQGDFALLCHEVVNIVLKGMDFKDIPGCMDNGLIPLTHLCLYQGDAGQTKLGLVTHADFLYKYISRKI